MKNPFVYIFAIPLYIIKFVIVMVLTIFLSFCMAVSMMIFGTDGVESKEYIRDLWDWFKQGVF